jgi:hypothetical protein
MDAPGTHDVSTLFILHTESLTDGSEASETAEINEEPPAILSMQSSATF